MSRQIEFMIDIETLSVKRGGIILEVACGAFFDKKSFCMYSSPFCLSESTHDHFTMDDDTMQWWEDRGENVLELFSHRDNVSNNRTLQGLRRFVSFFQPGDPGTSAKFWAKGSMDFEMLEAYYDRYQKDLPYPWKYNMKRDLRTALDCFDAPCKWEGVEHRAAADVKEQIKRLVEARNGYESIIRESVLQEIANDDNIRFL